MSDRREGNERLADEDIRLRLNAWLDAREAVGWFDGWPSRHILRYHLRATLRRINTDWLTAGGLMFALARSAWDEHHVIDVRHYPDGKLHIAVSKLRGGEVVYERGATAPSKAYLLLLEAAP